MARREYKGAATPTTLVSGITNSATSLTLTDSTNWPTGSFSLVIDPGLAGEEKILATSRTGTVVTLTTRGYDNTTSASHLAGAIIYPVPTAIDFDEANAHTVATTGVHGITGAVVGDTDTQTLTNKKLSDSTTTIVDVTDATKAIKFDVAGTTAITGTIATAFTTAKTVTLPDATDTLVGKATTDTLTNKTLTDPVISKSVQAQTGTTYTTVLTDEKQLVTLSNASAITLTLPPASSVAYPSGIWIDFIQKGAGQVTFAAGSGVTIRSTGATAAAPKLRVQYSGATAWYEGSDIWYVIGDLS